MENQELFNFLKNEIENKGIDSTEYKIYWGTLTKHEPSPCPLCFTKENKKSDLFPLNEKDGFEPIKCKACKEVFYIPVSKSWLIAGCIK